MASAKDHYAILGIARNADPEVEGSVSSIG
jgi:hypothetical protein